MPKKTRAEMLAMRATLLPRQVRQDADDPHRLAYNHPQRKIRLDIDAVCTRCGLEEVDTTPTSKKKTTRWRLPGSDVLMSSKPACNESRGV